MELPLPPLPPLQAESSQALDAAAAVPSRNLRRVNWLDICVPFLVEDCAWVGTVEQEGLVAGGAGPEDDG